MLATGADITLTSSAVVTGGAGGETGGGGGPGGGVGVALSGGAFANNGGSITGGVGRPAGLGISGGGGAGVEMDGGASFTNAGTITGGVSERSSVVTDPVGGLGGAGAILSNVANATNTVTGVITGGTGPNGGNGVTMTGGVLTNAGQISGDNVDSRSDGAPGAGVSMTGGSILNQSAGTITAGEVAGSLSLQSAAGIVIANGSVTITNTGFISGSGAQSGGTDGAGIVGAGLTVINGGSITGAGTANAITFTGGVNSLELRNGYSFTDNIVGVSGGTDKLILGGATDAAFDASQIGAQYQNFASFAKTGTSTWAVTGMQTATGPWTVSGGTLQVNGNLVASSLMTVENGATLGGAGTVSNTVVSDVIAPGIGGMGTLNVAGNITFMAGSTYEAEVNAAGQSDKIVASGTTAINGGSVKVLGGMGNYAPATQYTILTANGGRTGTFTDGVTSDLPFLDLSLSYDANNVYLTMTRNGTAFQNVGLTRNQIAAGNGVESLSLSNPIYNAVLNLSAPQAQYAFDQLFGEIHASAKTAMIEDSRFIRGAVNDRMRAAFDSVGAPKTGVATYVDGRPVTVAPTASRYGARASAPGATPMATAMPPASIAPSAASSSAPMRRCSIPGA